MRIPSELGRGGARPGGADPARARAHLRRRRGARGPRRPARRRLGDGAPTGRTSRGGGCCGPAACRRRGTRPRRCAATAPSAPRCARTGRGSTWRAPAGTAAVPRHALSAALWWDRCVPSSTPPSRCAWCAARPCRGAAGSSTPSRPRSWPGGPAAVRWCWCGAPGTGKTTTLVEAVVARVARDGLDPSNVLVLAPSRHRGRRAARARHRPAGAGRAARGRRAARPHPGLVRVRADPARRGARAASPSPRLISGPEQDTVLRELVEGHLAGEGAVPAGREQMRPALRLSGFSGRAARAADARARARARPRGPRPDGAPARPAGVGGRGRGDARVPRRHAAAHARARSTRRHRRRGGRRCWPATPTCSPRSARAGGWSRSTTTTSRWRPPRAAARPALRDGLGPARHR